MNKINKIVYKNFNQTTFLIELCKNNNIKTIKELIKSNYKCDFNLETLTTTALIEICKLGHTEILNLLIKNNKKLNIDFNKIFCNWTPIMYAIGNSNYEIVKLLLENINITKINLKFENDNKETILTILNQRTCKFIKKNNNDIFNKKLEIFNLIENAAAAHL